MSSFKDKERVSRIPKHNIKRLGQGYFKTEGFNEDVNLDTC